jgi:hypothetical protein
VVLVVVGICKPVRWPGYALIRYENPRLSVGPYGFE